MKTIQVVIISVVVISSAVFGIMSVLELPMSLMDLIISDVILGAILYLGYLVSAVFGSSKTKVRQS